jgi:SlyX protein
MEMEERLIEMETKLAFQDNTIEELSDVVYKQQLQIDQLKKELTGVQEKLRVIEPSLAGAKEEEPLPPHY